MWTKGSGNLWESEEGLLSLKIIDNTGSRDGGN